MNQELLDEYLKLHLEQGLKLTESSFTDFLRLRGYNPTSDEVFKAIGAIKYLKKAKKKEALKNIETSGEFGLDEDDIFSRLCIFINGRYNTNISPDSLVSNYLLSSSEDGSKYIFYHLDDGAISYEVPIVIGLFQKNQRYELISKFLPKSYVPRYAPIKKDERVFTEVDSVTGNTINCINTYSPKKCELSRATNHGFPNITKLLKHLFPVGEQRKYVLKYLACCVQGLAPLQNILLIVGSGGTGKTLFQEAILSNILHYEELDTQTVNGDSGFDKEYLVPVVIHKEGQLKHKWINFAQSLTDQNRGINPKHGTQRQVRNYSNQIYINNPQDIYLRPERRIFAPDVTESKFLDVFTQAEMAFFINDTEARQEELNNFYHYLNSKEVDSEVIPEKIRNTSNYRTLISISSGTSKLNDIYNEMIFSLKDKELSFEITPSDVAKIYSGLSMEQCIYRLINSQFDLPPLADGEYSFTPTSPVRAIYLGEFCKGNTRQTKGLSYFIVPHPSMEQYASAHHIPFNGSLEQYDINKGILNKAFKTKLECLTALNISSDVAEIDI